MQHAVPFDPEFHRLGTVAASGRCSQHGVGSCSEEPIISFVDRHGRRQAGCRRALDELSSREEITISSALAQEN
jgi:hypothetical protein